jgi:hypothetical protein
VRIVYDEESFKHDFKVGDTIESWATRKRLRITAIGERRFLGVDERNHEGVCTIAHALGWTKINNKILIKLEEK